MVPGPSEIYTLSLHDALPISVLARIDQCRGCHYFDPTFVPDGRLLAIVKDGSDRKSTRLNSSHANISYAVFCLTKKKHITRQIGAIHTWIIEVGTLFRRRRIR